MTVVGSPSGSAVHWMAWLYQMFFWARVPEASMGLAAIQRASGAIPMRLPALSSPQMVPIVCVPWLPRPDGNVVLPIGSNHAALAGTPGTSPRQRDRSALWFPSTPVSMLHASAPAPVKPLPQT